jgi:hypothetical protein
MKKFFKQLFCKHMYLNIDTVEIFEFNSVYRVLKYRCTLCGKTKEKIVKPL